MAILGATGSGKSTVVHLIQRLFDVKQGEIRIGGTPINQIDRYYLRSKVGLVLQEPFLFSKTLKENVAIARRNATEEEIDRAVADAAAKEFILDSDKGYDTLVGERGVTLSGGQKQRSSIARALLKDSPILILDDALSAVDTDTEETILENLKQLRAGKTTIMIAHRVSTVQNADHILVLDRGRIAEYGTRDELMERRGIFHDMFVKQQLEQQLLTEE